MALVRSFVLNGIYILLATMATQGNGLPEVVVTKMELIPNGHEPISFDLTKDLETLKNSPVIMKEGTTYRIKLFFKVKNEIVSGLRYHSVTTRKDLKVDKETFLVGSYGPKDVEHEYLSPEMEAPKGMISRGQYVTKSQVLDDNKTVWLTWEWAMDVKKDWE